MAGNISANRRPLAANTAVFRDSLRQRGARASRAGSHPIAVRAAVQKEKHEQAAGR